MSRAIDVFRLNAPGLSRAAEFASRASEWLVLAYLLLAVTPPILFHPHALTIVPHLNLLDGSWQLDTSYKAAGGIWFGRDVAFTYGPFYQWLSSAPSRWIGVSAGSVLATADTLPLYLAILATFVTTRLLLPESAAWRRALLVWLAVVYWSPLDVRVSLCLLAFAIFLRICDSAAVRDAALVPRGIVAAAICTITFLVSADTGLYVAATLLICIAVTAATKSAWPRMLALLACAVAGVAALVLATNAAMSSWRDFGYWKSSLAIATGYRWFEPLAMAKRDKHLVFVTLALGVLIFAAALCWRHSRRDWSARSTFLLAGFCTSVVLMQSALVRSDHGHVLMGMYPMVFLCGVLLLNRLAGRVWISVASAVVIVAATALAFQPVPAFGPASAFAHVEQLRRPMRSCPDGFQMMDGACFTTAEARWLEGISSFVRSEATPGAKIGVLPYETAFGLLSRHQVAGGVMQGYLANGEYLTGLELLMLHEDHPAVGLYFADREVSEVLDGVPNFTRSPQVWFYFAQHFRLEKQLAAGAVGLLRDESRTQQMHSSSQVVGTPLPKNRLERRSSAFDLGQVRWPEGADFLKLRVRVDYPLWWTLRKPSAYTLEMSFADGSRKSLQFVLQPGRDTDIWVYPWNEETLASYFSADESQWRAAARPAVTGLRLLITPHDWVSVVPTSVSVESIEAVRINLQ